MKLYGATYDELMARFLVPPLVTKETDTLFLLESGHTNEVLQRTPVAGASGKSMTKQLLGEGYDEPFGMLLRLHIDATPIHPALNRLGIVNVSVLPMQRAAYGTDPLTDDQEELIDMLEILRKRFKTKIHKTPELEHLQSLVTALFQAQMRNFENRRLTIIPCGKFAESYLERIELDPQWTILHGVPHPSFSQWERKKNEDVIAMMKQAIGLE